jgi:hypothetical protein
LGVVHGTLVPAFKAGLDGCRNIPIALKMPSPGEETAQACDMAWLRQLSKEAAKIGIGERDL